MFRTLATLAIAVSTDLYLFDGRYARALWQIVVLVRQHL